MSIPEQAEQGLSYAKRILPECALFPESFCFDHNGVFADKAVSGWNKPFISRPAGSLITDRAVSGDHLICYSIDRMARNLRDFANTMHMFETKGVFVHFIVDEINTATAAGRLKMHIRAAIAQFSSDLASERMREAHAIRRLREGKPVSKPKTIPWAPSEYTEKRTDSGGGRTYGTVYRYERVSSQGQYTSGLGLEHQSTANLSYANRLADGTPSIVGEAFVEDAISAYCVPFAKRPEGKRLLDTVKPGDDVVVYRCDRAWRNLKDAVTMAEELKARGVYLHFVKENIRTDSVDGVDWLGVMASMAQLESSIKSRRNRDVRERLRREGRPLGRIPFGFKATPVNNHQKLTLDIKPTIPVVATWLLRTVYGFNTNMTRDAYTAWKCRAKDKLVNIMDKPRDGEVHRLCSQAEAIKAKLPARTWGQIVDRAHDLILEPMEHRYWRVFRWDYDATIQERVAPALVK